MLPDFMKLLGLRLHKAALVWKLDVHGEGPCERERNNYHFAIDKRGREVLENFEKTPHGFTTKMSWDDAGTKTPQAQTYKQSTNKGSAWFHITQIL